MKVCGCCGLKFDTSEEYYAFCASCEDEMEIVTIEEIETHNLDNRYHGISWFNYLDFETQFEYIMLSDGSDTEKLNMINKYFTLEVRNENRAHRIKSNART